MPRQPFQPPTGLISDETMFYAPNHWISASGIRFYEGNWQARGGYERMTLSLLKGVCRSVLAWTDTSDNDDAAFGLHNGLMVWRPSDLFDITPAAFAPGSIDGSGGDGYGSGGYGEGPYGESSGGTGGLPDFSLVPLTWALANYGGDLMANPRGQTVFHWLQDTAVPAVPLANAPAHCNYMVVVPQRQVMVFGCEEEVSGVYNGRAIRWSDIEDPTDWTTDPSNNAGEYILESAGYIVCARVVGDYVLVWTTTGLYLGTFVGAPGQTWKFERQGAQCGAISPGAPVVKGQNVAWISPDAQFWQYQLGSDPAVLPCPIRDDFANNITVGQKAKIVGALIPTFQELQWFYPDARDGFETSRALSISPDGWTRDLLARTAYVGTGPFEWPIGVTADGIVYWQDKGVSADGGPLTGFIESTDVYLNDAEGGLLITACYPNFRSQQGAVMMTLYAREFPARVKEKAHGPWTLTPLQTKRSLRVAGRILRVRFDFSSAPFFVRGGKPEFDVTAIGGR